MLDSARRHLPLVHFAVDSLLWSIAIPVAVWLRYDYDVGQLGADLLVPVLLGVTLQGLFGVACGLYRRRWRYGSFDEVRMVACTAGSVGVVLTATLWSQAGVPRSVPMLATGLSLLSQIAVRSAWRLKHERSTRPSGGHLQRLLVVGAGDGAEQVLRTLRGSSDSSYLPVAMLDDDPSKRNLRLSGVRVEGRIDDLASVAANIGRRRARRAECRQCAHPPGVGPRRTNEVEAAVFPVDHLLGGVGEGDIRPVNEADLLGRHPPTSILMRWPALSPVGGCW